jgi:hypothetical protein
LSIVLLRLFFGFHCSDFHRFEFPRGILMAPVFGLAPFAIVVGDNPNVVRD